MAAYLILGCSGSCTNNDMIVGSMVFSFVDTSLAIVLIENKGASRYCQCPCELDKIVCIWVNGICNALEAPTTAQQSFNTSPISYRNSLNLSSCSLSPLKRSSCLIIIDISSK